MNWQDPGSDEFFLVMTDPKLAEPPPARERFEALLHEAVANGSLLRLTLGAPLGKDRTLRNLLIRPVALKQGPRLSFVWRHLTQDITKNFTHDEGLRRIQAALGTEFRTAHLTTSQQTIQLEYRAGKEPRLVAAKSRQPFPPSLAHDRPKRHPLSPQDARWLQDLGVTTPEDKIAKGMEDKFRQIQRFVELLQHLLLLILQLQLQPQLAPDQVEVCLLLLQMELQHLRVLALGHQLSHLLILPLVRSEFQ